MMRLSRTAAHIARPILRIAPTSTVRFATSRAQIAQPAAICRASVRPFSAQTAWRTTNATQQQSKQQQQQSSHDGHQHSDNASSSSPSTLLPLLRRLLTFLGVTSVTAVGTFQLLAHTDALRWLGDSAGDQIAAIAASAAPPKHLDLLLNPREGSKGLPPLPPLSATLVFLGINVAVFAAHQLGNAGFMHRHFHTSWAHLHASPPLYHTLITSVFSHSGLLHLAFNSYGLFMFGSKIERDIGTKDFVIFYLAAGVLSSVGHLVMARALGSRALRLASMAQPCLGASGSVFGLLGLATLLYPREQYSVMGITPYFPAESFFPVLVGVDFGMAMYYLWRNQLSSMGHWAHISGYLVGIAFGMTYLNAFNSKYRAKRDVEKKIHQLQLAVKKN